MNKYLITKRIAKQGKNSVIIIPKLLQDKIKPADLVQVEISLISEGEE